KTYKIGKVRITNGRLDIVQTSGQSPLKIELANVRGSFWNVQAPWGPGQIDFKCEASANILNGPLAPRQVTGRGWIDPHRQDIHGNIFFRDPDGREQLSLELRAGDNELKIDGVLKMEIAESEEEMPQESTVEKMLSQAMAQAAEGESVQLETRFSVREKLDEFRLDRLKVEFQGAATAPDPVEKKVLPSE
ncbi:MAG: hypothetical protein K8I00_01780, partial [Candidatus Omnitrophica bacterium]|nr:hypothetical protein [Candidatus Omnitrophota bacterium]